MVASRVTGTIGDHGADVFVFRDLYGNIWLSLSRLGVNSTARMSDVPVPTTHGQMGLAPLASALNTVLVRLPFAVTLELDSGAAHEQIQRPTAPRYGF